VAAVASFLLFPLPLGRLCIDVHTLMPPSAQFNPGQETAARAAPRRPSREFVLVLARAGTDWDNRGKKKRGPGSNDEGVTDCHIVST
jgi:hypothetical protein